MATEPSHQLADWQQQGADRLDRLRFDVMLALARRAAGHQGAARQLLDQRLDALMAAYATDLAQQAGSDGPPAPQAASPGPLAGLALALHPQTAPAPAPADGAGSDAPPLPTPRDAPAALDEARQLWSQVRARGQVRQSLQDTMPGAGPLNSTRLLHRTLTLMHALAPGCLEHYLAYVDVLAWMEPLGPAPATVTEVAARSAPRRPRAARRPT